MQDSLNLISALPVTARPGYSLGVCLEHLEKTGLRAQKTIRPSFLRKLLGGVSKDHARSVIATCSADLHAISRAVNQIKAAADLQASSFDNSSQGRGAALSGYCTRLLNTIRGWQNAAAEYEAAVFGSERDMAQQCGRLLQDVNDLATPVGQLDDFRSAAVLVA